MAVDFSKSSPYNSDANFQSVKFGADAPLLETELNEMQDIQNEARADIVRESIPSGFTLTGYTSTNYISIPVNNIKTSGDSTVFVNGYKITIPSGMLIPLDAPPITGTRDDLVFLEVWKEEIKSTDTIYSKGQVGSTTITNYLQDSRVGAESSRRIQLKWRIRVASGVDFASFPDGISGFKNNAISTVNGNWNDKVMVQGGNASPIASTGTWVDNTVFYDYTARNATSVTGIKSVGVNDYGLYVAGRGDQASKDLLKTADGYSYAIPMYRVERRNSTPYNSVTNPNGGLAFAQKSVVLNSSYSANTGINTPVTMNFSAGYSSIIEGEIYRFDAGGSKFMLKVLTKDGNNNCTVMCVGQNGVQNPSGQTWNAVNRPDFNYYNMIDENDLIDLRHVVSFTGFDLERLAVDNFDKLTRAEYIVSARGDIARTYHGLPRTPIDSNTTFYASMDGTLTAEVGGLPKLTGTYYFQPSPIGAGLYNMSANGIMYNVPNFNPSEFTIDMFVSIYQPSSSTAKRVLVVRKWGDTNPSGILCDILSWQGNLQFRLWDGNAVCVANCSLRQETIIAQNLKGALHFRFTKNATTTNLYMNGNLMVTSPISGTPFTDTNVDIDIDGIYPNTNQWFSGILSDISISKVDRGNVFKTLPADVISGTGRIGLGFNGQKKVMSDAMISQAVYGFIGNNRITSKGITKTGISSNIANGDKIKVTGLMGDTVMGAVDADTALARVVQTTTTSTATFSLALDNVTGIAVNDNISILNDTWGFVRGFGTITVNAVDTTNKMITVTSQNIPTSPINPGNIIVESTTASSLPLVRYFTAPSTWTTIAGTWTGVGTAEATFTCTEATPISLADKEIQIDYTLVSQSGQGTMAEVYQSCQGGEHEIRQYDNSASHQFIEDYTGKVASIYGGNVNVIMDNQGRPSNTGAIENPLTSTLLNEIPDYSGVFATGGTNLTTTATGTSDKAQQVFAFDAIGIIERRYGAIPFNTLQEKVAWAKQAISNIEFRYTAYGYQNTAGYGLTQRIWNNTTSAWDFGNTTYNSTLTSYTKAYSSLTNYINDNGFMYFMLNSPARGTSDGVSQLFTDYVSLFMGVFPGNTGVYPMDYDYTPVTKRLIPTTVSVIDDFKNKTSGQAGIGECPNTAKVMYGTFLYSPSSPTGWVECTDDSYTKISSEDGTVITQSTSTSGQIPQQLYSFNLIRIIEDKFGTIPASNKVWWIRNYLDEVKFYIKGSGSNNGTICYKLAVWRVDTSGWLYQTENFSASNALIATTTLNLSATPATAMSILIDNNGYANYMVYGGTSAGTASSLNTDYARIEIKLKRPIGYNMLSPENPRRDAGRGMTIFMRYGVKEVSSYFDISSYDKLSTFGTYVPYQGMDTLPGYFYSLYTHPIAYVTTRGTAGICPDSITPVTPNLPIPWNIRDYKMDCGALTYKQAGTNRVPLYSITGADSKNVGVRMVPIIAGYNGRMTNYANEVLSYYSYQGYRGWTINNYAFMAIPDMVSTDNYLAYFLYVGIMNGELVLLVVANRGNTSQGFYADNGNYAGAVYRLMGRPLTKAGGYLI